MIQLIRPDEPDILATNRANWTTRWTNSLRDGRRINWATPRALSILRTPLIAMSHGKCAFCEGVLGLTSYEEIEHYHSKVVQPELVFEWQNLFPACRICNGSKGERDHAGRLLKPDHDDPEPLLWLHPGTGELQPHPTLNPDQQQRVLETIETYNLQRGALCNARIEMMKRVNRLLKRLDGQVEISADCREEWLELIHPSQSWKFVLRHTLTLGGLVNLAATDRQTFLVQG